MCGVPYHSAEGYIARLMAKDSCPSASRWRTRLWPRGW